MHPMNLNCFDCFVMFDGLFVLSLSFLSLISLKLDFYTKEMFNINIWLFKMSQGLAAASD